MKSNIKILWIIALTVVIALVMIACDILNQNDDVDNSKYYLDPPTGVVATILSTSELHLTWNAVSGAGHYEISVRSNLDSTDTRLKIGTTSNTSTSHGYYSWYWYYYSTRAEEVTTIYYYVKAHPSKAGYIESEWSSPASVDITD
jgi:hypothetical protein